MGIYRRVIKPILFKMDAEKAHNFTLLSQAIISHLKLRKVISPFFNHKNPQLESELFGLHFKNPIGLPAGCDKKGNAVNVWEAYGFGWATVGSITHQPQSGNEKPRLFRLIKDESMQVNFGLNSIGADKMFRILKKKKPNIPFGISIARTTDIPDEEVVDDYVQSFIKLYEIPHYFEINISCPNIPDTDYFRRGNFLKELLGKFQEHNKDKKPLLLKIGVELDEEELQWIAKNVRDYNIDGIITTNLIKDHGHLEVKSQIFKGGISGKLLRKHANKILGSLYQITEGKVPLIGLGGIFTGKHAYEKIKLGASLLQVYTGMVLHGPGVVKKILKELVYLLKKDGYENFKQAIGAHFRN